MSTINYRDIDLNFTSHPVTRDVAVLTNKSATDRVILNLLKTKYYEKPFRPRIGSDISDIIFHSNEHLAASRMIDNMKSMIEKYDSRIHIQNITATKRPDTLAYDVLIEYNTNSQSELNRLEFTIDYTW